MMNKKFWKNKKILITGHTGFKGRWLSVFLDLFGAKVYGISLKPQNTNTYYSLIKRNYYCDINDFTKLQKLIKKIKPQIIFHLAAQSLVLSGYKKIVSTYKTNFMGSINVLEASKASKETKALLITTTDKVYRNKNNDIFFYEDSELGGKDPYSASKAACEIAIQSYIESDLLKNVNLASMRAGNVIGGGDFATDRLMTDLIKHFQNKGKKQKLIIRNPNSIRPWQYVLDVVKGYILLAEKLYNNKKFVGSYNFGPNKNLTKIKVKQIVKEFQKYYNMKGNIVFKLNITNNKEEKKILLATKKVKKFLMFKNKINSLRNLIERSIFVYNQIHKKNIKLIKKIYLEEIKNFNND
jgi:CDP-glucose 4,6-dehydratase